MDIQWESILGHERTIRQLRRLWQEGRMPHAMLFCGAEGIGKRRTALSLAAMLLCEADGAEGPCGRCESCAAFQAGTHPDFYLVEPESRGKSAKSIKIEQIRELQTRIAWAPKLSPRRVILMDGVELMNEAAANSLLKTIEEPPGPMFFILVTSTPAALLDTIRSRCMRVEFGMLPQQELARALPGHGIPAEQAPVLASLSDGSLGRALQLYADGGLELRADAAGLLRELADMDMDRLWKRARALSELPREKLADWCMYLSMLLRDMLVLYSGGQQLYHQDLAGQLARLLPQLPESRVFSMLALLRRLQKRLESNANVRLLLESFLIQIIDKE